MSNGPSRSEDIFWKGSLQDQAEKTACSWAFMGNGGSMVKALGYLSDGQRFKQRCTTRFQHWAYIYIYTVYIYVSHPCWNMSSVIKASFLRPVYKCGMEDFFFLIKNKCFIFWMKPCFLPVNLELWPLFCLSCQDFAWTCLWGPLVVGCGTIFNPFHSHRKNPTSILSYVTTNDFL